MILSMYPFQIMCVCFITQVGKALSQIEQIVNMMSVTYLQLTFTCLHHKMLENLYFPFLKYHTPDLRWKIISSTMKFVVGVYRSSWYGLVIQSK